MAGAAIKQWAEHVCGEVQDRTTGMTEKAQAFLQRTAQSLRDAEKDHADSDKQIAETFETLAMELAG